MPSFGGNPGNRAPAPAPSQGGLGGIGQIAGQAAHAVQTAAPPVAHAAAHIVNSVPPAYRQAIVHTFDHQSSTTQASILRGAIRLAQSGAAPAEAHIVLQHVAKGLGPDPFSLSVNQLNRQGAIRSSVFGPGSRPGIKTDPSQKMSGGGGVLGAIGGAIGDAASGIGDAAKFVYSLSNPQRLTNPGLSQPDGPPALQLARQGAAAVGKGLQALPLSDKGPGGLPVQSGVSSGQFTKNLLKDAVNLGVEALPSTAIPIEKAVQGHWKEALNMVTQPYVDAVKHPIQSLEQHPVTTSLMAAGVFDPASALVERGVRGVAGKGPVNRTPESVQLTGQMTHERPAFSQFPRVRATQKSVEKVRYTRNQQGQLVPRDEAVRGRLTALETSRLVGQNNRVRSANHQAELKAHADAVIKGPGAQIAHGAATALRHNPEPALIAGHSVLGLISEGIIRRPQTLVADLMKFRDTLQQNRPHLNGDPAAIADHTQTLKDVNLALKQAQGGRDFGPAFKAAAAYAKDYKPTELAAQQLGHFRDMTPEALQRRTMMGAVAMHMPGARFDPVHGMVRDTPIAGAAQQLAQMRARETQLAAVVHGGSRRGHYPGEVEAARAGLARIQRRISEHRTHEPIVLSTGEMARFMARETGGRHLGFVSHELRRSELQGDAAHYVNQERRPQVARMGDTLYALQHGLTNPTHEALLHQRVRMRGIVDAHRSFNRLLNLLTVKHQDGGYWRNFQDAARAARGGRMVPVRISQQFHPAESVTQAMHGVTPDTLSEDAARHSLDINSRLQPSSDPGQYALIHRSAANRLLAHEKMLAPNAFIRSLKGLNTQFRKVALATSFRHLPGVAQESLIRAAASGVGPISLLAGHAALARGKQIDPVLGRERAIQLTGGGQVIGATQALATRQTSRHFEDTLLYKPLKAWEAALKAPGARHLGTMWRTWQRFTLDGTKKVLEEQLQVGALGKQVIRDFGSNHGLLAKVMGDWGKMIDQAGHGILDETTARRLGAGIRRITGTWTDLSPHAQSALMFSPFGMWWANSVAWLARMPTDHPIGTAFQAGLNQGTQQERQKLGLDLFQPNSLPLFKQGAIPINGKLWQANYYSPVGTLNDPAATAGSLVEPWWGSMGAALFGKNWLLNNISTPGDPKGKHSGDILTNPLPILTVLANSVASSFVPLVQKAATIAEGGAPKYDTSGVLAPQTKAPNPGPLKGLIKAVTPLRLAKPTAGNAGGGGGFDWSGGGSSSGGSSSGGGSSSFNWAS